ncbi:hypothetical protein AVEN_66208-1 [Araneus ventricosus]|uniref:Integrase catalytic domain-containing protein n=1 Tax=Araneus ventricosus TaxID=182803 RepID=A0A4Y2H0P4_ARAVE|nr:hypothetical protein AVEN_66208-1 [Araneus ventricosus]
MSGKAIVSSGQTEGSNCITSRKGITQWANSCIPCQKKNINRHTRAQIATYKELYYRFIVIHTDIIGPFPNSERKTHCLTCIDRFTCWIEVIPLANVTAERVARKFYDHWNSRFGMPNLLITDQGSQFRSELFKIIGVICGFKICTTVAYHPQCNGEIESIHWILKTAIRGHNSIEWTQTLSTVLLRYSNFSLQQACHKFVMTRVQACSKLTKASKSPWNELAASWPCNLIVNYSKNRVRREPGIELATYRLVPRRRYHSTSSATTGEDIFR